MFEEGTDTERGAHRRILRRVGAVLFVVGLIDIGTMVYCIIHKISYSSSFNIFACIGGFFLWRGSLRATSIVRFFAAFMTSTFATFGLALSFALPAELIQVVLRSEWPKVLGRGLLSLAAVALLIWIWWQLTRPNVALVVPATRRAVTLPILVGALCGLILGAIPWALGRSADGRRAAEEARKLTGPNLRYFVRSMHSSSNGDGWQVTSDVIAYDDHQFFDLKVHWRE